MAETSASHASRIRPIDSLVAKAWLRLKASRGNLLKEPLFGLQVS